MHKVLTNVQYQIYDETIKTIHTIYLALILVVLCIALILGNLFLCIYFPYWIKNDFRKKT